MKAFKVGVFLTALAGVIGISLVTGASPAIASAPVSEPSYIMTSPLLAAARVTGSDYTMVSCPLVTVDIKIKPKSLNLKSKGKWVTAYIIIPPGYSCSDIDISSIRLNGVVPVSMLWTPKCSKNKLKVKFLRSLVKPTLSPGNNVPVSITGLIAGLCFEGIDYIKVKAPHVANPVAGEVISAGTTTVVTWTNDPTTAGNVTFQVSLDGGATFNTVATNVPNTGSYTWNVSNNISSSQAQVRILTVYEVDDTGEVPEVEEADSELFVISATTGVGSSVAEFALRGTTPSPAVSNLRVNFSLRNSKPATLSLFDLSGRQIESRGVEALGPGWHTVTLGERSNLPAGMYLIRLSQDGRSLTSRATLVR